MTEKTILQQIKTLAYGALNTDDDQEQYSKLMEIIELTDDTPPFAVGEYYFAKYNNVQRIYRIEKYNVPDGRSIAIKAYAAETGELITFNWGIDQMIDDKPATVEQIATFKRAEQFAKHGRKLDEFRVGDLVNCKSLAYDNGYYIGDLVISRINKQGLTGRTDENLFYTYALPNFKKITLIQTTEELQEVGDYETI